MENFKKISKLSESKVQKQYALTAQIGKPKKSKDSSSNNNPSALKYSVIQESSLNQEAPTSIYGNSSKSTQCSAFTVKNLDNNKVQLISVRENENYQECVDRLFLQGIQQLPEVEAVLEKLWDTYLNEIQKEEEEFLEACYQGNIKNVKRVV